MHTNRPEGKVEDKNNSSLVLIERTRFSHPIAQGEHVRSGGKRPRQRLGSHCCISLCFCNDSASLPAFSKP